MKYQTAVFDVSKPADREIQVPLDSDYGVAVKVGKNGRYAEDAAITLGGEQPNGVHNGWTLFQRATGSQPQARALAVEVSAALDSGDGLEAAFRLNVVEKDFGYIETSGQSGSYDVQYVGLSPDALGEEVVFAEGTVSSDLWFQTNATDLDGKLLAYAVYSDPSDQTPYVTGSFDATLQPGLAKTTVGDVSEICPETMTSYYVKTWIQDEDYVDPGSALGTVLDWTAYRQA